MPDLIPGFEQYDLMNIFIELFKSLDTFPFSGVDIIRGYPKEEILNNLTKPVIYVMPPEYVSDLKAFGSAPRGQYAFSVGVWSSGDTGGISFNTAVISYLVYLFGNSKNVYAKTFDVTFNGTDYEGVTLRDFGIITNGIRDLGPMPSDNNQFRNEARVFLI